MYETPDGVRRLSSKTLKELISVRMISVPIIGRYVLYGNILEFKLKDVNYIKLCYISFNNLIKFAIRKFQGQ